jgi:HlyD family secretion protein
VPIQSVTTRESKEEKAKKAQAEDVKKDQDADVKEKKTIQEVVFVIENGKAKAINVKTGIQDATNIEILTGLKADASVVKAPFKLIAKTLQDGDMVQVVQEKDLYKEEEKKP